MTQQNNMNIEQRLQNLERQMREHSHNGFNGGQIFFKNLFGLFETVSEVPTTTPKTTYDQIKIYSNSTTYRLYWYDSVNGVWRYATGT